MKPENCLDCPHHLVISDEDPDDWFNSDDVAVVCLRTLNPHRDPLSQYLYRRHEHRSVTCACRPHHIRKETRSPCWCPLGEFIAAP